MLKHTSSVYIYIYTYVYIYYIPRVTLGSPQNSRNKVLVGHKVIFRVEVLLVSFVQLKLTYEMGCHKSG